MPYDYVDLGLFNLKHLILQILRLPHQLLLLAHQLLRLVLILVNLGRPTHLLGHIPLQPPIRCLVLICVEHVKLNTFLESASVMVVEVVVIIEFHLVVSCQRLRFFLLVFLEVMPFHCKSVIFVDNTHQV